MNHPFVIYSVCVFFFVLSGFFTLRYDLARLSENTHRDYLVWDSERVHGLDLETLIEQELEQAAPGGQHPVRARVHKDWVTNIIYESRSGANLLDEENLRLMGQIETAVLALPIWPLLCLA